MTFVKPEIRVVDGGHPRLESPEAEARSFEQPEIQDRPPGHGKRGEEKRENAVIGIIQQGRLPDDQRGEEAGSDTPESKEDGELSGLLIQTMIERGKAKELVKTETLDRAAIETLIVQAGK